MASFEWTNEIYFTTTTVVEWIDVFTRPLYKHILLESLIHCQKNKGLDIYAWVLMPNHLHMIVGTHSSPSLSDILRDFKKYTSKKIVEAIESNQQESRKHWILNLCQYAGSNDKKINKYHFWQEGNHVEQIWTYAFFQQKLNYIHMNPVRQEIVEKPEEYLYSSARNYAGMNGLIDVIVAK